MLVCLTLLKVSFNLIIVFRIFFTKCFETARTRIVKALEHFLRLLHRRSNLLRPVNKLIVAELVIIVELLGEYGLFCLIPSFFIIIIQKFFTEIILHNIANVRFKTPIDRSILSYFFHSEASIFRFILLSSSNEFHHIAVGLEHSSFICSTLLHAMKKLCFNFLIFAFTLQSNSIEYI